MYYLINSAVRLGEELKVEANSIAIPVPTPNTGVLTNNNSLLANTIEIALNSTSGEAFKCSVSSTNLMSIGLTNGDAFIPQFGNSRMSNVGNLLGFPLTTSTTYSNSYTGTNAMNLNGNITNTDEFICNIANLNKYSISVHPSLYIPDNLCIAVQSRLNIQTGKSWTVSYNSGTNRITIAITLGNAFKILWADPKMYNLALAMGFEPINMTTYQSTIIGTNAPVLNSIITDEDFFNVIVNSSSDYITTVSSNFAASNVSAQTFLNDLQLNLSATTNMGWTINRNPTTNLLTISTPTKYFQLLNGTASMSTLATAMGFPLLNTTYANLRVGSSPVNTTASLDPNAVFSLNVQDANNYEIPPNTNDATIYINTLQSILNTATGRNWSVSVSPTTNRATIAILNSDSLAQILFADSQMATIRTALGFNSSNTTYGKTFTGTNTVNYATTISLSNRFKTNIQTGAFSYQPNTDSTSTLVAELQNSLTQLTGFIWEITVSSSTGRITFKIINSGYQFQLLFGEPSMATIASALGFSTSNTSFVTSTTGITSPNPINNSAIINFNSNFFVNVIQTTAINYSFPSNRTSTATFIASLQSRLNTITALNWNVTVNPTNSKIKIEILSTGYAFKLNLANAAMTQLGYALGFNVNSDTDFVQSIEGVNAVNYNFLLNSTDFFLFDTRQITTIKTTNQYNFPIGRPTYNPLENIEQVQKRLSVQSKKNWNISYNNSRITANLIEADSSYRILWGDPVMSNIGVAWGFNTITPTAFTNSSTGVNPINFNKNLIYTDKFLYEMRTTTYYQIVNYNYSLSNDNLNPYDFINNLAGNLFRKTGDIWTVSLDPNTLKLTITLTTPDKYFFYAFGYPLMKNIAKLLGFPAVTVGTFTKSITSPNPVDYSVELSIEDQMVFSLRTDNYKFAIPYSYRIEQENYDSQTFILQNLQTILNNQTGKSWTVQYNTTTKKLSLTINSANCGFKMFFNNTNMRLIAEAMGFNPINSTTFFQTITSDNQVNFNILLNQDNVFTYEVRDTTGVLNYITTTGYQWMIDPPFYEPSYFFGSIQNYINPIIPYTLGFSYNTTTQKLTISSSAQFRIFWQQMTNLAKICGFNTITSASYSTSIISDGVVDMLNNILTTDFFIVEFIQSQRAFALNFYNIMGSYYAELLKERLYYIANNPWTVIYNPATSKFTIGLSNLKFLFSWGQALIASLADIYGFSKVTGTTYTNSTTSDLVLNTISDLATNNTIYVSFQPNEQKILKTITMEPIIYANANIFCNVLQYKLCQSFSSPPINFFCNYDGGNNKISVATNSISYQFKLYLGNCQNTATLLGMETSNISPYSNETKSDKECYFSGQLSRILLDLRQSVSFSKIKLVNINLGFIYNIADGNNKFYFSKNIGGIITNYLIRIQPANYTGINLTNYLKTAMNSISSNFIVNFDTNTQKIAFGLTDGNTFQIDWDKNRILAQMCGFNPISTGFITNAESSYNTDFVYPKVVYLSIENIRYSSQLVNNRFMFYISLGNINYNQQYDIKTELNKMIVSLHDENNNLLALNSNWQATVELF